MPMLTDLFDMNLMHDMVDQGYVSIRHHPVDYDLCIANYTDKAVYDQEWNEVTTQCRGLIYYASTGTIVARPFAKFFNHNEPHAPKIELDEVVEAYDKLDGSLGIVYYMRELGWQVASRGSFTSEQAYVGTLLLKRYLANSHADTLSLEYTTLVEIIYPENKIVVNYGDFEGLVTLGSIDNESGKFYYNPELFVGEYVAACIFKGKYEDLLQLEPRKGMEGLVVHTWDGRVVKLKQEEYVRLHRLVSNLSRKTVWEHMEGPLLHRAEEMTKELDEEHRDWVLNIAQELIGEYVALSTYVNEVAALVVKGRTRKEVALAIKDEPKVIQSCIFKALDNRSYTDVLWKHIKPKETNERKVTDE